MLEAISSNSTGLHYDVRILKLVRHVHYFVHIKQKLCTTSKRAKNALLESVQIRSFFWSLFSCIWTEYGGLLRKSLYLVQIQQNTEQKKLRI